MKVVWSRRKVRHLVWLRDYMRDYIVKDSEQNAAQVAGRILKALELLERHPELGRAGRLPSTRELEVAGTPYVIPYRVRRERLELIAVFHGRELARARHPHAAVN